MNVSSGYFDGSTINFECEDGYSLKGENSLVCDNGKWSGEPPICDSNSSNSTIIVIIAFIITAFIIGFIAIALYFVLRKKISKFA